MAMSVCPQCGAVLYHDDSNKDALANHIREQHPLPSTVTEEIPEEKKSEPES